MRFGSWAAPEPYRPAAPAAITSTSVRIRRHISRYIVSLELQSGVAPCAYQPRPRPPPRPHPLIPTRSYFFKEISAKGGHAKGYAVDLAKPEDVKAVLQKVSQELGTVTVLFWNPASTPAVSEWTGNVSWS